MSQATNWIEATWLNRGYFRSYVPNSQTNGLIPWWVFTWIRYAFYDQKDGAEARAPQNKLLVSSNNLA